MLVAAIFGSSFCHRDTGILSPPYSLLVLRTYPPTSQLAAVLGPSSPCSQPPRDLALPNSGLSPVQDIPWVPLLDALGPIPTNPWAGTSPEPSGSHIQMLQDPTLPISGPAPTPGPPWLCTQPPHDLALPASSLCMRQGLAANLAGVQPYLPVCPQ